MPATVGQSRHAYSARRCSPIISPDEAITAPLIDVPERARIRSLQMSVRTACFAAFLLLIPLQAFAWTPRTEARIADKGAQLAPPDLRLLLDRFAPDFRRGLTSFDHDPASEARHVYVVAAGRGALRTELESEIDGAVRTMRRGGPMSEFVESLGRIAHLVGDVNNPFHVANDPPRLMASRGDFEQFVERRLEKFPTVFYGLEWPVNIRSYLDRAMKRTAEYYPLLDEEYFRGGARRSASEFDDRSTGFGVASISYSHAVTDLVHVYYHIWKEAGGDVRSAAVMRRSNLLRTD